MLGDQPFSPAVTSEYGTFYNMSLHQRKSPSLSHPLSTLQFKVAAGNTKPLHVAHEISIIILQTCCTFTRCCSSDQNSDAICHKREKTNPNKQKISYSLSCNPLAKSALQGTSIIIFSGFHLEQTQHAQIQKHHVMR